MLDRPLAYARYVRYAGLLREQREERLVFCHHFPVITLGLQTRSDSVLFAPDVLAQKGIGVVPVRRGGDATAHEPGQIVIYPHLDLRRRGIRLSGFVKSLLDVTADLIRERFSIALQLKPGAPGLYAADGSKVVSAGIEVRRGFSSSGIALNWNNSLATFESIHPCGYPGLRMQSLTGLLQGREKKNDLTEESRKREFCRLWAERFSHSLSQQHS